MSDPILYEINTRCWLRELSESSGGLVTLANIPEAQFLRWQRLGFSHIWLMGVWTSGPRARAKALHDPAQIRAYSEALPDWREEDVTGSPYAIAEYSVPAALGGDSGLEQFRQQLRAHGLRLILDFVPNHLGLDSPWLFERPELFVQGVAGGPGCFQQQTNTGCRWLAHGKDPNFSPWTDTVQLDYRSPATRVAMLRVLESIAERCDGVRCDMAMLVLNDVFGKTWLDFPCADAVDISDLPSEGEDSPRSEFWFSAIAAVKRIHPQFLFLAEAYWGLEARLCALGFDFTYDKELYDRLVARDPAGVQRHLLAIGAGQAGAGAHFLENHDERRVAAILSPAEHRAAALVILALPGMRFLHEGQLTGAHRRVPVQLRRRMFEPSHPEIEQIYAELLGILPGTAIGRGRAEILPAQNAWPGNPTAENFVLIQWQPAAPEFDLAVANLAAHRGQCLARLTVPGLSGRTWRLTDLLGEESHLRRGDALMQEGLFLDLPAHAAQIFRFRPVD